VALKQVIESEGKSKSIKELERTLEMLWSSPALCRCGVMTCPASVILEHRYPALILPGHLPEFRTMSDEAQI
jgi:hypothetical protein